MPGTDDQGGVSRESDHWLRGGIGVHLDSGRRTSDGIGLPHRLRWAGPHVFSSDWWPVCCSGRLVHLVVSEVREERTVKRSNHGRLGTLLKFRRRPVQ